MPKRKKRKPGPKPKAPLSKIVSDAYLKKIGVGKKEKIYHNRFVKDKAVEAVMSGKDTAKNVAKRLGVGELAVYSWIRRAKAEGKVFEKVGRKPSKRKLKVSAKKPKRRGRPGKDGSSVIKRVDKRKKRMKREGMTGRKTVGRGNKVRWDKGTKDVAVSLIFSGDETINSIASRLGVSYSTVQSWVSKAEKINKALHREKHKKLSEKNKLKPTSLITDWSIDYKIAESDGHVICNSCFDEIKKGNIFVLLRDPDDQKHKIVTHCIDCLFLDINETKKYLDDMKKALLSGDKKIEIDLSNIHDKYNCIYMKRVVKGKPLGPLESMTRHELIEYLQKERMENLPDKLKQLEGLEDRYFEETGINDLLKFQISAFKEEKIWEMWHKKGMSIRKISSEFGMATQTIKKMIENHQNEIENPTGKALRLERENRQLRRVLCYFAERVL